MTDRKTKDQLANMYPEQAWRDRFLKVLGISSLLRHSIIKSDYAVPDDMNTSIYLTTEGTRIHDLLIRKHDVPAKEARLLCLLITWHRELLIDIERTNLPVIIDSIGKQMAAGAIRYPFILGRTLYDRAAELFPDERETLSTVETTKLLEDSPQGIWQVEDLVTGPYGLLQSSVRRSIPSRTLVPLQHCSDLACNAIHFVQLATDYEAPINVHRPKITRLLEQGKHEPWDWGGFIDDLRQDRGTSNDDMDARGYLYLLGDAFSLKEQRDVVIDLIDRGETGLRALLIDLGLTGSATSIAAKLDSAQLLQVTLLVSDDEISKSIDTLVQKGVIDLGAGEVRRPRVNSAQRHGPWELSAELGEKGVRLRPASEALPTLRLRRLISALYDTSQLDDMNSLDWQLRDIDRETPSAKLAELIRVANPETIVKSLVLARQQGVEQTQEMLKILPTDRWSDDNFVRTVLWKLGFSTAEMDDPHASFWKKHAEIMQLARASEISAVFSEEPIKDAAGVYFSELERLLDDSLVYVTWALTTDHYGAQRPFVFQPASATVSAWQTLNSSDAQSTGQGHVDFSGQNTLYPLTRGFRILADHLELLLGQDETSHLRRERELPPYLARTNLQTFPFTHTVPFLDLRGDAQQSILTELRFVSKKLLEKDVPRVRNDLLHFRRSKVETAVVLSALDAVGDAVKRLSEMGFLRTQYQRLSTTTDEWGRHTITMVSASNQHVSFSRPSTFDWLPLPSLSTKQYLMHSAIFADPNEMLRFRAISDSVYQELWSNYPKRRQSTGSAIGAQFEHAQTRGEAASRAGSRTLSGI